MMFLVVKCTFLVVVAKLTTVHCAFGRCVMYMHVKAVIDHSAVLHSVSTTTTAAI